MAEELEVKFLLSKPESFLARLDSSGAKLVSERIHEYNLRFDTPDRVLAQSFQVLRLRRDTRVRITYKGPGNMQGGVQARREIEFEADNFEAAKALIEALGFEVSFIYEKYRTTYHLRQNSKVSERMSVHRTAFADPGSFDGVEIVVDETPVGTFTEIEGPDAGAIQLAASRLGLDWDARIAESYLYLFENVKRSLELPFRDLTFENFEGVTVTPSALGVKFGDE